MPQAIPPAQRNWILAATILGSSMVFINSSTVNVALPAFQRDLGASVGQIQWIINGYLLSLCALMLVGGSLGDLLGRKKGYLIGILIFSGASIACGFAANVQQLIAARAIQGVGGAFLTPGSLAIINETFPREDRGKAIGLWSGFTALTSALGPVIGGYIVDTLSWRYIFFVLIPVAVLTVFLTVWKVPESKNPEADPRIDWLGALLVAGGLGGLVFGFIEANERGFIDPLVWGTLVGGTTLLLLFFRWERYTDHPMLPLSLFQSVTFNGANALTFTLYTALGAALFFLPLNLQQIQGYSATEAGAAFLPFILILSLLSSWAGGLINRVGARVLLTIGPLVVAGGFLLMAQPSIGGAYWGTFFPGFLVLGLGMAISVAPLTASVMGAAPDEYAGTASGINNAISRVANLFAVAIFGLVMVQLFSNQLPSQLSGDTLPVSAQQRLLEQRTDLAEIEIPKTLSQSQRAFARDGIHGSFVFSFRRIMYICALGAVLSALIAWITIDRRLARSSVA